MPLLTGTITVRKYKIAEPPPEAYLAPFTKGLTRHAFKPIDDRKAETESFGWVNARNLLDNRMKEESWHFAPYIVLGFRIDKKSIPTQLFKARVQDAVRRTLRQERRTRLSKDERGALETNIKTEMLSQTLPSTSLVEAVWNLESNVLHILSSSSSANDRIVATFTETFECSAIPQFPYLVAEEYAETRGLDRALEGTYATDFGGAAREAKFESQSNVQEIRSTGEVGA